MNHYRNMMEQVALSGRKKEEIMEQLEAKGTQKRRMPKARTIILAAALAVGALLSIAAGLPARVYHFATGGQVTFISPDEASFSADANAPIRAEDGRLWFEADGRTVDITGMVDENTPYIYERTDPGTGEKGCVVVGGTAEDFGWAEFTVINGKISALLGNNYDVFLVSLPDGSEVAFSSFAEAMSQLAENDGESGDALPGIMGREVAHPWFQAALDQLGLEWYGW